MNALIDCRSRIIQELADLYAEAYLEGALEDAPFCLNAKQNENGPFLIKKNYKEIMGGAPPLHTSLHCASGTWNLAPSALAPPLHKFTKS